jgi:hypothetical protein
MTDGSGMTFAGVYRPTDAGGDDARPTPWPPGPCRATGETNPPAPPREVRKVVRFVVREVVKEGHYKDYKAACKAWNDAAVKLGLPAFRYFSSGWDVGNEVFLEADYEDSGDIERRFAAADGANDPAYEAASQAIGSHKVDGQTYNYLLSDIPLG